MTPTVTARIDLDGSRFDRNNPTVEYFGRTLAHRPERDLDVSLHHTATLAQGEFARSGGSERYPAVGDTDHIILEVTDVPASHPDLNDPNITLVEESEEQQEAEEEAPEPEQAPVYVRLDTDALDALGPVDAYEAATTVAINQAKEQVAAYADAIAYRLAVEHGHRGAARELGVSQRAVTDRVHRHRDRTKRITPDHIRELHEEHLAHSGQLDRSRDRCFMVLAYADGQIITCLAHTADQNGWTILYSAYDLDSWLDGTDLTDGDATQLAQEVNSE